MGKLIRFVCDCSLGLLLLGGPVMAGDYYVDAVNGNNANAGTSPGNAWRTVTFAVNGLPSPPTNAVHTIHIAAGTYDAALGEVFPLNLRPRFQLMGVGPTAVLDGGGQAVDLIQIVSLLQSQPFTFTTNTIVQDLALRRGQNGVWLRTDSMSVQPLLRNLAISEMSVSGLQCFGNGHVNPVLQNLVIESNQVGVTVICSDPGVMGFEMSDSIIRANLTHGFSVVASGGATLGSVDWTLRRCRIESNGGDGIHATAVNRGGFFLEHFETLIRGNGGRGVWVQKQNLYNGAVSASLYSCTVADNLVAGVMSAGPVPPGIVLRECIVYGNNDDIVNNAGASFSVMYCDIGDPDFTGEVGVFHADPLFVNPGAGDYRLQSGSPCIDTGMPPTGFPNSPLDPDCSRSDVGAHAFTHAPIASYCVAKPNSCGSLPTISGSGTPSAGATSGFVVSAVNTKGTKAGLLMYGVAGRASVPFSGGTLCVNAPVSRTIVLFDTTGTAGPCNGRLDIDMNAFASGALGGNPLPSLKVAGTRVDCQFWGRDTPTASLLSDALEYFTCP